MAMTKKQRSRLLYRVLTVVLAVILCLSCISAIILINETKNYEQKTAVIVKNKNDKNKELSNAGVPEDLDKALKEKAAEKEDLNKRIERVEAVLVSKELEMANMTEEIDKLDTHKTEFSEKYKRYEYEELEKEIEKLKKRLDELKNPVTPTEPSQPTAPTDPATPSKPD